MKFPKAQSQSLNLKGLNSFNFGVPKRWNYLSESNKNIAIVNQFKKKLRNRTHSYVTLRFRGTGVYQNAY